MDACKLDKDNLETDEKEKNKIENKIKNTQEQLKRNIESAREKIIIYQPVEVILIILQVWSPQQNNDISNNKDNSDSSGAVSQQ